MKLQAQIKLFIIIQALLYGTLFTHATAVFDKETSFLLLKLDSIIANRQDLIKEKELRISRLRDLLREASTVTERRGLTKQLYDEYIVFDSDSALHYAMETGRLSSEIARDDYDEITKWHLNEAFIYTVQGVHEKALDLLKDIDPSKLNERMKSMYFSAMAYIYSMRSMYLQSNPKMSREDLVMANRYRDSIQLMRLPKDSEWLWVPIAAAIDKDDVDLTYLDVTDLKKMVDENSEPSRTNAINAYWLSRYYERLGDNETMLRYKIQSAIYDAIIVNREIAAIQEIATYLFENGDLNRAYVYLTYCVEQANLYHNRYRMVNLSDILPTVRDAYREELEKRDRRQSTFVIILATLSLLLLLNICFIIFEYNKLKKMRNLLKASNSELQVSISERDKAISNLETANHDLIDANKQKLGLLAYAFKLTTQYINALEDYRKRLLKKYKGRKIDDLGEMINDPELIKEQYQEFYESFDKTVLSIFPDFIDEYNKTAPDVGIVSSETIIKTRTLNTRLRIYALRRLGITKSAEIAEMLNISIRTVYNNRPANTPDE